MFKLTRSRLILILCLTTFLCFLVAWAQQESVNFTIPRSVLDGGGGRANSSDFALEDSIAQPSAIGFSSSANFRLNAGYQQPAEKLLKIQNVGVSPTTFNPTLGEVTTLSYVLSTNARAVTITVDDRTLVDSQPQKGGFYTIQWDGSNDLGEIVTPGKYTFTITAISYEGEEKNARKKVTVKNDTPIIFNVSDTPDPFFPATDGVTTISYTANAPPGVDILDVTIELEDAGGLAVTDITFDDQVIGSYSQDWDGTDAPDFAGGGNDLRDGLYIYRINAKTNPPPKRANEKIGTIVLVRNNTETETSDDSNLELRYQPDSFTIDITKAAAAQLTDATRAILTAEPSLLVQSEIYDITAIPSTTFDPPAILTFKYDPAISGEIAKKLQIRYFDIALGQWVALDRQFVDTVNNQIIAEIDELSLFAIFTGEDTTAPLINITSPEPAEYYNTSTIDITYDVEDPVVDGVSSGVVKEIVFLNGEEYEYDSIYLYDLVGENILTIKAYDKAGNIGRASVPFTVILEALVRLKPEALKINPGILTAFVEFPEEYDVRGITDATCDGAPYERMMLNDDETRMIIKFRRADIEKGLAGIEEDIDTHFIVRGTFTDELESYIFEGTDTINKILGESAPSGKGGRR